MKEKFGLRKIIFIGLSLMMLVPFGLKYGKIKLNNNAYAQEPEPFAGLLTSDWTNEIEEGNIESIRFLNALPTGYDKYDIVPVGNDIVCYLANGKTALFYCPQEIYCTDGDVLSGCTSLKSIDLSSLNLSQLESDLDLSSFSALQSVTASQTLGEERSVLLPSGFWFSSGDNAHLNPVTRLSSTDSGEYSSLQIDLQKDSKIRVADINCLYTGDNMASVVLSKIKLRYELSPGTSFELKHNSHFVVDIYKKNASNQWELAYTDVAENQGDVISEVREYGNYKAKISGGEFLCTGTKEIEFRINKRAQDVVVYSDDNARYTFEKTPVTITEAEKGLDPNAVFIVKVIDLAQDKSAINALNKAKVIYEKEMVYAVYDIKLKAGGEEIQPDSNIRIRMKVPDQLKDKVFRIFHIHSQDDLSILENTSRVDEEGYITFTTNKLSSFAFVSSIDDPFVHAYEGEKPLCVLHWIICGIMVLSIVAMIVIYFVKRNQRTCISMVIGLALLNFVLGIVGMTANKCQVCSIIPLVGFFVMVLELTLIMIFKNIEARNRRKKELEEERKKIEEIKNGGAKFPTINSSTQTNVQPQTQEQPQVEQQTGAPTNNTTTEE